MFNITHIYSRNIKFISLLFLIFSVSFPLLARETPQPNLMWTFENASIEPATQEIYDKLKVSYDTGKTESVMIGYEAGETKDRTSRIADDPAVLSDSVLHYWLKNATIPGQKNGQYKGRIQVNIPRIQLTELSQRFSIFLHPDLELYKTYPEQNTWFTILELWMGQPGDDNRFRINLNIGKQKGVGKPLLFLASGSIREGGRHGHGEWKNLWEKANFDFEIPTGQWLDVEIGYKQGNKSSGRFVMTIKKRSESIKTRLFNIRDWTYHPLAPEPVPLTMLNPLKLYTSSKIIDHVRNNGGIVQVYWDNFALWDKWIY